MIVPDVYAVVNNYGLGVRLNEIPDELDDRKQARFFELVGYKYTSIAERAI